MTHQIRANQGPPGLHIRTRIPFGEQNRRVEFGIQH
jgi:hypothetical protein